ncbi:MAG: hypothetical protein D6794_01470, partial [Deltaproteobacteria bacterium]
PTLSAFGRAFKQGALTDVGEQALVEDEALSIPSVLNATMVLRPQFQSTNTAAGTVKTIAITADQVILFGGRLGSNSGAFIEYDGTYANYQQFNSWDLGGFKAGFTIFNTGFGETAGMEVGSTFGQHGGLLNGKDLSANNIISKGAGGIGGVAFFGANDLVTASVSLITGSAALDGATGNGWKLAPSIRVFANPEVAGWEIGAGVNFTSGSTGNANTAAALGLLPGTSIKMKKWGLDLQAHGELGDTQIGVYADYASAAAPGANEFNLFNQAGTTTSGALKGWSVRANVKPVHNIIVGAGFGNLKDNTFKQDQWQIGVEYELYQNFVFSLIYNNTKVTPTGGVAATTKTTLLDIEALL